MEIIVVCATNVSIVGRDVNRTAGSRVKRTRVVAANTIPVGTMVRVVGASRGVCFV